MAAISAITVVDGKSTPEPHVYQPIATMPAALYKRTGIAGQPAVAMEKVQASLKSAVGANGLNIGELVLSIPVLEQTAGGTSSGYVAAPSLAHELKAKVTFYMHNRSDAAGRKDLRVLLKNLLDNPQIIDLIENLTPPN